MDYGLRSYKRFYVHEVFILEVKFTVKSYYDNQPRQKLLNIKFFYIDLIAFFTIIIT